MYELIFVTICVLEDQAQTHSLIVRLCVALVETWLSWAYTPDVNILFGWLWLVVRENIVSWLGWLVLINVNWVVTITVNSSIITSKLTPRGCSIGRWMVTSTGFGTSILFLFELSRRQSTGSMRLNGKGMTAELQASKVQAFAYFCFDDGLDGCKEVYQWCWNSVSCERICDEYDK